MNSTYLQLLTGAGIALAAALMLFPLLIKLSPVIGLVDKPNHRKLHKQAVAAVGGLVIILSIAVAACFSVPLQQLIIINITFSITILTLTFTGMLDDRFNLPVKLRLLIQLGCAFAIAFDGTRITSLHGFLGIHQLPEMAQYFLTVIVIAGVTNAFNLIDGIDGLAGSMALVDAGVLMLICFSLRDTGWLYFLIPLCVALMVFLKYNWRPARIFMGDSGSLAMGFIISATGIHFISEAGDNHSVIAAEVLVLVTGYCMIPVLDAMRVFYARIKKGHSPFHADRTHLHHLLTNHHLVHSTATSKLMKLHISILIWSAVGVLYLNVCWIVIGQAAGVLLYVYFLKMMAQFQRWYRVIKRMEMAE